MSKEITVAKFFRGIELPNGSYLTGLNGERLSYGEGERLVDGLGRYGYSAHFSGSWVCYTCGVLCECGEGEITNDRSIKRKHLRNYVARIYRAIR
jgi:hypothetical protein